MIYIPTFRVANHLLGNASSDRTALTAIGNDNALTLTLQVNLGHIEHLIQDTTGPRTVIMQKFERTDIEIAFLQLDVHIDTNGRCASVLSTPGKEILWRTIWKRPDINWLFVRSHLLIGLTSG